MLEFMRIRTRRSKRLRFYPESIMKRTYILFAWFVLAIGAAWAQDPKKTAAILTGDAKGAAANNPVCKLFTSAEASKYIGKPVSQVSNAAGGSGCQWATKDYEGDMMVQVVPARYHEQPSLAKGFQRLADVGTKGFVVPELGGWKAATLRGEESVVVTVAGPAASQQGAIALLKETLARKK
jgi:hypothetical protein